MPSYLTDAQKAEYEAIIRNVADTFSRPLVIVRQANEVALSDSPNYSFVFPDAPNSTEVQVIPVTGVFQGRIWYERRQMVDFFSSAGTARGADQINVKYPDGTMRLKLDPTGAAFINGAERVLIDGNIFRLESTPRPHGLFTPQYYTYWLKKDA